MIPEEIHEAVMWAQRYCIDYQSQKSREVTLEFLTLMEKVAPQLSPHQLEHLCIDVCRHITSQQNISDHYPEMYPSPEVMRYFSLLSRTEGTDKKTRRKLPVFELVRWAAKYCITRGSYAAGYGTDVVKFLSRFSDEQKKILLSDITEYITWRQEQWDSYTEEERKYAHLPDNCWYALKSYLEAILCGKTLKVTTRDPKSMNLSSHLCFKDDKGYYRVLEMFIEAPHALWYIAPEHIVEVQPLNSDEHVDE